MNSKSDKLKQCWKDPAYRKRVFDGLQRSWDKQKRAQAGSLTKRLWREGVYANRPSVPCSETKKQKLSLAAKKQWRRATEIQLRTFLRGCQSKYRRNPSLAETVLQKELRKRKIHYRSQEIITPYVVDLLLVDFNIVVECDSPGHRYEKCKRKDKRRDVALVQQGFRVVRLDNKEIIQNTVRTANQILGATEQWQ